MNLGINSITALGHNTAQILKINEVKHLCRQLLKEGHQVAEASGIQFHIQSSMTLCKSMPAILIIWGQVCITI